jgi:hypothetical protein
MNGEEEKQRKYLFLQYNIAQEQRPVFSYILADGLLWQAGMLIS